MEMKILPSNDIDALLGKIAEAGKTVVTTHSHPDGDALGSCVAMLSWIRGTGAQATVILPEKHPDSLDFILPDDLRGHVILFDECPEAARKAISECGLVIALDMNSASRAGDALGALIDASPAYKVLIDHHPGPDREAFSLVFSETEISSASELLYYILKAMPGVGNAGALPKAAAAALMAGMTTDTNNFANSVFPTTLRMASELLDAGVDRDGIVAHVFNSYGLNRISLMGRLLDKHLRITPEGVAYMILTRRTARAFNVREGDTEGLVNIPLTAAAVRMSIFLREEKDRYRVSIRSRRGVSSNGLAALHFHGGGHEMAAGGKLLKPGDARNASEAAAYIETVTREFLNDSSQ